MSAQLTKGSQFNWDRAIAAVEKITNKLPSWHGQMRSALAQVATRFRRPDPESVMATLAASLTPPECLIALHVSRCVG